MKRILILVEGQTEEVAVRDLLGPHLANHGLYLTATVLKTKRPVNGPDYRGGVTDWPQVRRDVQALLRDTAAIRVTTMIDYYGLKADFPGMHDRPSGTPLERVVHVEAAIAAQISDPRFLPHLVLHEFEAWLFADPSKIPELPPRAIANLRKAREDAGGPEQIDEGPETAPSKRILRALPSFRKTTLGNIALKNIGLQVVRQSCPHFNDWLTRLESLSEG